MKESQVSEAVARWLGLVAADAELSPYLIGVDRDRLAAHVAQALTSGAEIPSLGWSEAEHRRAESYVQRGSFWRKVERAATKAGDGPAWWPVEVLDHDLACDGVAVITVRPWRRLPYQPGQAVPVCTPRRPGHWRWYCPANAPRPDGTIELHVRAVPGGTVSTSLVHQVRPGELLHLGPPADTGLSLHDGDLLLIAGGTGLAPLRALVEQVAAAPHGRQVTLVVGSRSVESLYDPITLDKLQQTHHWLTILPAFSHDLMVEPAEQGDALTIGLCHRHPDQHVYVSGPPLMLAGARLRLLAAGVPAEQIHLPDRIPWQ